MVWAKSRSLALASGNCPHTLRWPSIPLEPISAQWTVSFLYFPHVTWRANLQTSFWTSKKETKWKLCADYCTLCVSRQNSHKQYLIISMICFTDKHRNQFIITTPTLKVFFFIYFKNHFNDFQERVETVSLLPFNTFLLPLLVYTYTSWSRFKFSFCKFSTM